MVQTLHEGHPQNMEWKHIQYEKKVCVYKKIVGSENDFSMKADIIWDEYKNISEWKKNV